MARQFGVLVLVLVALAVLFASSAPLQAQGLGCGSMIWGSPYPADLTPLYSVGAIPLPPYFALHPPVYYDLPVPRTYGYSPWAYLPYITTPEIEEPAPLIIENKFVPKPVKESEKPKIAYGPRMIPNPYVLPQEQQTEAALAAR